MDIFKMSNSHIVSSPVPREGASLGENSALCWLVVTLACLAAVSIVQPTAPLRITGITIACALAILALVEPWLGILALFPLSFSVATPPDGIGAKETVFAVLTLVILARSVLEYVLKNGVRDFLRTYALPILFGTLLLGINLAAAIEHHVPLTDWLRGAAPFAFIFMAVPIAIALRTHPERVKWLGIAVLAVAIVFCAYILGYYALHHLWQYRWFLKIDGKMVQVSESVAAANTASAVGPFVERITALVPSSTDALIPISLAIGFALAILAESKRIRLFGGAMMALALPAILVTYTRSMLLSPLLVIAALCCYLIVYRRDRLKRAIVLLTGFSLYGIIVIEALGLELAWLNRGATLFEALKQQALKLLVFLTGTAGGHLHVTAGHPLGPAVTSVPSSGQVIDDNVATRIDEYRVAWKMFLDHPLVGNGLGAKHRMAFVRSGNDVLYQNVGYIHNWPLYMLMAGGLLGFAGYAVLLIRPVACRYRTPHLARSSEAALRVGLGTLAIYALFFAVVRLITFNLLIAAAWGICLAFTKHGAQAKTALRTPAGQSLAVNQVRAPTSMAVHSSSND